MTSFPMSRTLAALLACSALGLVACDKSTTETSAPATIGTATAAASGKPTAAEAEAFVTRAEAELAKLVEDAQRADWVYSNFITDDTEILSAQAGEKFTAATVALANEAARFDGMDLSPDLKRKLMKLKLALTLAAPKDPAKNAELAKLSSELNGMYGKGKYCNASLAGYAREHKLSELEGDCLGVDELSNILADEKATASQKLEAWKGWHAISVDMKPKYVHMVEIANEGAKELGFADTGALWRSKYDMPAEEFPKELDRLWGQVKPLYNALQCHVRAKLSEHYGKDVVPLDKPIPAHLLGNMWAQEWGNVYDFVKPEGTEAGFDLTQLLKDKQYDAKKMAKAAENFFVSLGFEPLPETFWTRSLFTKPRDRDVICHASAWDIDSKDDLRIKMCMQVNAEDFVTVHHEEGHNFYQRAYKNQPPLYQDSANDGFHEAIGDTIALSVTPKYLVDVGLLDKEPDASQDLPILMRKALDSVAFLPFGLLIDQWRWKVFSGEVKPEDYNKAWWELRTKYQGVMAPEARGEEWFDAGAKYHVPGNTPYTRYFLARILQFQFHRDLCKAAGYEGPLHRCSIYGNKVAGEKLKAMLEMGASKPWQDALATVSGKGEMDASAILDYFAPLQKWLDEQNKGRQCGW